MKFDLKYFGPMREDHCVILHMDRPKRMFHHITDLDEDGEASAKSDLSNGEQPLLHRHKFIRRP